MPTFILLPSSTVTTIDTLDHNGSAVTIGGNPHLLVSDDIDTTFLQQNVSKGAGSTFDMGMTSDAVNPLSIQTFTFSIRTRLGPGYSNDNVDVQVQVLASDLVTPLTDRMLVGDGNSLTANWATVTIPATGVVAAASEWSGAVVHFVWTFSKVGKSDTEGIQIAEFDCTGDYTQSVTIVPATLDLVNTGTITSDRVYVPAILAATTLSAATTTPAVAVSQTHTLGALALENTGHLTDGGVAHTHSVQTTALVNSGTITSTILVNYLTAADTVNGGTLASTVVAQDHTLGALGLEAAGTVQAASSGQLSRLTYPQVPFAQAGFLIYTTDLYSVHVISSAAVAVTHALHTTAISASATVSGVAVTQQHELTSGSLASNPTLGSGAVSCAHLLATTPLTTTAELPSVVFGAMLTAPPLLAPAVLAGVTLTTTHTLSATGIAASGTVSGASVTQRHELASAALANDSTVQSAVITASHLLSAAPLTVTADLPPVVFGAMLNPIPLVALSVLPDAALSAVHILSATGVAATHSIEAASLTATHILGAADVVAGGTLAGAIVSQTHLLGSAPFSTTGVLPPVDLVSTGELQAFPLASQTTLPAVAIQSRHTVASVPLTVTTELLAAPVASEHLLSTTPLTAQTVLPPVSVGSVGALGAVPLVVGIALSSAAVVSRHVLSATGISATPTVSAGAVATAHLLSGVPIEAPATLPPVELPKTHFLLALPLSATVILPPQIVVPVVVTRWDGLLDDITPLPTVGDITEALRLCDNTATRSLSEQGTARSVTDIGPLEKGCFIHQYTLIDETIYLEVG